MTDKKKIRDFVPQVKNPNLHNTFGMRLLEKSIQNDGWIGAQTAAKDGEIIAGSARQEIAIEKFTDKDGKEVDPIIVESDGSRPVIIVRTDIENADTARARRLSAAENQIAKSNYNPDFELLKEWGGEDEQIKKLFSDDEWREGTGEEKPQVDADPQIDRAAELAEKWQTKSGQLWKLGDHRLLIGDCTVRENVERLMGGERADMVFTDPPYNVKYSGRGQSTSHEIENDDMPDEDFYTWLLSVCKLIDEFSVNSAPYYLCHGDTGNKALPFMKVFEDCKWKRSSTIIWVKNAASMGWQDYRSQHECISYGWKDNGKHYFTESRSETTIWDISRDAQSTYDHPTQKPVALPSKAIRNSSVSGALLYEPFAGSGTTIIAAHNLNRRCYAMEISPAYCGVILERFATATGITPELMEE